MSTLENIKGILKTKGIDGFLSPDTEFLACLVNNEHEAYTVRYYAQHFKMQWRGDKPLVWVWA